MIQSKRVERSRAAILAAADALFRRQGLGATSMEEIAAGAGVTRRTVYNLFPSKEEIGLQLIAMVEAQDGGYRARISANENVATLLEAVLGDSAAWCLANPALALLALSPATRPTLEPPAGRPSFQGLVRDILALGQRQGIVRRDEDVNFMALVLLGIYGQAMLTSLAAGAFDAREIGRIVAIVMDGIGQR